MTNVSNKGMNLGINLSMKSVIVHLLMNKFTNPGNRVPMALVTS